MLGTQMLLRHVVHIEESFKLREIESQSLIDWKLFANLVKGGNEVQFTKCVMTKITRSIFFTYTKGRKSSLPVIKS